MCYGLQWTAHFLSLLQLPILLLYVLVYSPFSLPPSIGQQKVSAGFGAHPASYPSQLAICFHAAILLGLFNPKMEAIRSSKMSVDGFVIYVGRQ
jgi:hypothetical protein